MTVDRRSRLLRALAVSSGIPLTLAGLFLIGAYIAGVVDIMINRPADRSWIFWGLGVAFIGVTLLVSGAVLLVVWWNSRLRE